jgi:epoxyqueuosine reductase
MRGWQGRFREGLGLRDPRPSFAALALEAGFQRAGLVDPRRLAALQRGGPRRAGHAVGERPGAAGVAEGLSPDRGDWSRTHTIVVCALSCFRREPDDLSSPGDPHGLIAPFARRNYYTAAVRMLRQVAAAAGPAWGFGPRDARIFSNSRLPEKLLLEAAGLSRRGSHSLQIIPGLGSLFIIAGAMIPVPYGEAALAAAPGAALLTDPCGSCELCARACPAAAITPRGALDAGRCLQELAARDAPMDDAVKELWGARLYGCQACQDACPWNKDLTESSAVSLGDIGPSISLRDVIGRDEDGVRSLFRGTPMGLSWVSPKALLRNALVSAGNSGEPCLGQLARGHAAGASAGVRDAALWAVRRCESRRATCGRR